MIETLYPGVYLAEHAFRARPIDGVPTTGSPSLDPTPAPAPDWTEHGPADPGRTLLDGPDPSMLDAARYGGPHPLARGSACGTGPVVSPWIGETEKSLGAAFASAAAADASLVLDEADALFGRRRDVTDAHDRHAGAASLRSVKQGHSPLDAPGAAAPNETE